MAPLVVVNGRDNHGQWLLLVTVQLWRQQFIPGTARPMWSRSWTYRIR